MKYLFLVLIAMGSFNFSQAMDDDDNSGVVPPAGAPVSPPASTNENDPDGDGIMNVDFDLADVPRVPAPDENDPLGVREAIREGERESSNCNREPRLCDLSVYRVGSEGRQRCGRGFRLFNITENAQFKCQTLKELEPFRSTPTNPSLNALVSGRSTANRLGHGCGVCIRTNLLSGN